MREISVTQAHHKRTKIIIMKFSLISSYTCIFECAPLFKPNVWFYTRIESTQHRLMKMCKRLQIDSMHDSYVRFFEIEKKRRGAQDQFSFSLTCSLFLSALGFASNSNVSRALESFCHLFLSVELQK